MKTIYILKSLTYKNGTILKCNTPYTAVWNNENSLWAVQLKGTCVNVSPKFVEKVN